jgi:uncharacterized membrane protein
VTLYPQPVLNQFCPAIPQTYTDAQSCVQNGGQWTNYELTPTEITTDIQSGQALGTCNANFTCENNFAHAQNLYNRNAFIILIVLSLVILIVGIFIPVEVLSLGFTWGGALSLVIATLEYWSDANNTIKFVILIIILVFLIWVGTKRFRTKKHVDVTARSK